MNNHQIHDQRPSRPATAERSRNALSLAEQSFRLLIAGPKPLAIDGRIIGNGLPARAVDLGELRELLLGRGASDGLKDTVWRELIRRARSGAPAWTVGCVGMAMPGLKSTAARVIRSSPSRLADDIVSELLTEFVAQLARIDVQRPHIAARLMLWARKGALRARGRDSRETPCDPWELPEREVASEVDPVLLVVEAARQGIIASAAAELIIATRLDGLSVQDLARDQDVSASRLYKQRHAAEVRLVNAIRYGRISVIPTTPGSEMSE